MRKRIGRFRKTGVRKVNVPNLSGLTRSQSQTALSAVGLVYSESTTDTLDSSLTNYIQSQNKSGGETVLIGSTISFIYYNYVAPYYAPYYAPPVYHAPPYHEPYYAPAPYHAPTNNCQGYSYAYGEARCGGYASIYNGCGQFLGCND